MHRGRTPQFVFIRSRTKSAVVFGSTLIGLSSGTGGGFTVVHSVVTSLAWTGIGRSVAIATRSIAARQQHDLRYFMTASFELGWARHMTGVAHLQVIMIRHFQLHLYNVLRRAEETEPSPARHRESHRKTARSPGRIHDRSPQPP